MSTKTLVATVLVFGVSPAAAQRPYVVPVWADSALRAAGLNQRFSLSSTLTPSYAFADFDRDGLVDFAVEVRDAGGLRCGLAIVHQIDRSVHLVGAGAAFGDGQTQIRCGEWGLETTEPRSKHAGFRLDVLYVTDADRHIGWIVWDGHAYRWIATY